MHALFAVIPVTSGLAATCSILDAARWHADAGFIPGYLGIALLFTLFVTPLLISAFGVPAHLAAAKNRPIEIGNWHSPGNR